jgi:hypothetical protein
MTDAPWCRIVAPTTSTYSRICAAVAEREDNHDLGLSVLEAPLSRVLKAAGMTRRLWQPGREITVEFMGGSQRSRKIAELAFTEWEPLIGLSLKPVRRWGDVRVAFTRGAGAWSYIGTDCLTVNRAEPTMNLGWDDLPTAMHEVGHMLGLVHEHQNPLGRIPWNVENVVADYSGPPNWWDRATIQANVLNVLDASTLTNGGFDPTSIMLYPIPARHVLDPAYVVGVNRAISSGDKALVKRLYPLPETKPTTRPTPPRPTPTTSLQEAAAAILAELLKKRDV